MEFRPERRGDPLDARYLERRRIRAITQRNERAKKFCRVRRGLTLPVIVVLGLAGCYVGQVILSPWPASVTFRHLSASRNCAAARATGLAPAYRGEPGYWSHLDADDDGISCEPWPHPRWDQAGRSGTLNQDRWRARQ